MSATSAVSGNSEYSRLGQLIRLLESAKLGAFDAKAYSQLKADLQDLTSLINTITPWVNQTAIAGRKLDMSDLKTRLQTAQTAPQDTILSSLNDLVTKTKLLRSAIDDAGGLKIPPAASHGSGSAAGSASGLGLGGLGSGLGLGAGGSSSGLGLGSGSHSYTGTSSAANYTSGSHASQQSQPTHYSGAGSASGVPHYSTHALNTPKRDPGFFPHSFRCLDRGIEQLRNPKGPFGSAFTQEFADYRSAKKSLSNLGFLARLSLLSWMLGTDSIDKLPEFVLSADSARHARGELEMVRKAFQAAKDTNFLAQLLKQGPDVPADGDNMMLAYQFNDWAGLANLSDLAIHNINLDLEVSFPKNFSTSAPAAQTAHRPAAQTSSQMTSIGAGAASRTSQLDDTALQQALRDSLGAGSSAGAASQLSGFEQAMKEQDFMTAITIAMKKPPYERESFLLQTPFEARQKATQFLIDASTFDQALELLSLMPKNDKEKIAQQEQLYDLGKKIIQESGDVVTFGKIIMKITDSLKAAGLTKLYFLQKTPSTPDAVAVKAHDRMAGIALIMQQSMDNYFKVLGALKPDEQAVMVSLFANNMQNASARHQAQVATIEHAMRASQDVSSVRADPSSSESKRGGPKAEAKKS